MKDGAARAVNLLHRSVFRLSGGRVGDRGFGMPVVMLDTVGRKSGKRRTTMLTSPVQEDGRVVIVASYGGDDRHPSWYLNLRENPDVSLTMGGETRRMRAKTASAEERAELWPKVVGSYKGYGQYQERTDREIPLVILEPSS
jgi:deazaflavin-dependent oxidoreductase (nitroreductase family)